MNAPDTLRTSGMLQIASNFMTASPRSRASSTTSTYGSRKQLASISKINVLVCAQTSKRSPKSGKNSAKKNRIFVRLGKSARRFWRGLQHRELQLGCKDYGVEVT